VCVCVCACVCVCVCVYDKVGENSGLIVSSPVISATPKYDGAEDGCVFDGVAGDVASAAPAD